MLLLITEEVNVLFFLRGWDTQQWCKQGLCQKRLRVLNAPICRTCPDAPRKVGEMAVKGKSGNLRSGVAQRDSSGRWDRTALGTGP